MKIEKQVKKLLEAFWANKSGGARHLCRLESAYLAMYVEKFTQLINAIIEAEKTYGIEQRDPP